MPIYWIEWQFWSWKSALSTHIARNVAIKSTKLIAKQLSKSWNIILSNIKMDKELIPNYFYFEDDKFLQILRTCNSINDLERAIYWTKKTNWWLIKRERKKFSRFYIFFDEAGAIMNNHIKLENNWNYAEYINQNRKNFEDIYIVTAKWWQTNKTLRQHVDWWYYVEPFSKLPLLCDIWLIRRCQKDEEGKILMQQFIWKDQNGDLVRKEKPVDEFVDWFWKPWIWSYYDDLHKNISDPNKYEDLDTRLLTDIILHKKELIEPLYQIDTFLPLKNKFTSLNKPKDELLPNTNNKISFKIN